MSEYESRTYVRWVNESDAGQSDTRVRRWHETYNAALQGLIQLKALAMFRGSDTPGVRPAELAQNYADETHGPIDKIEVTEHWKPGNPYAVSKSSQRLRWIHRYKLPDEPT